MMLIKAILIALLLMLTALGCANSRGESDAGTGISSDTDIDSDSDSDSDTESDADAGIDGGSDDVDAGPEICAESDIEIVMAPPQLMILEDMSNSMQQDENGAPLPEPTKWTQARNALSDIIAAFSDQIDFGLDIFPNDWICGVQDPCLFDTTPDIAQDIIEMLSVIEPEGGTPLFLAMERFTELDYAPNFTSGKATSYLVIVSDGEDTCGIDSNPFSGPPGASALELADLTKDLLDKEIKTFVIGFGEGVDPSQLSAIAAAGGTELSTYMDAQNQEELDEALSNIAQSAVSCVYEIEPPEESDVDMNKVDIYFDGVPVGLDPFCGLDIGWTWVDDELTMVKFCEAACQKIKDGLVEEIQIMYGCLPEPAVE